ncbi:Fic family protein [bacterium]|nr:Fic family protein [bacterium]
MRELLQTSRMFTPEYTITPKILSNIGTIEYGKAVVETRTILQNWQNQLEKEAKIQVFLNSLPDMGINPDYAAVKEFMDNLDHSPMQELKNLRKTWDLLPTLAQSSEIEENSLKQIHETLSINLVPKTKQGKYRSIKVAEKTHPEELLAQMVEFFDWLNSREAKETHPILKAGIFKAVMEQYQPFEPYNPVVANLGMLLILKMEGYGKWLSLITRLDNTGADFTKWLEHFTEGIASETATLKEKVQLLAKDTKVAKATGRAKISARQERIVEYLQDYGMVQNKDFGRLFPNISEDTVLRDLKRLIDKGIVEKQGSTKNSYYELV